MPPVCPALEKSLPAILFAAGFAFLFRRWLFTGLDGIFGDEGDGEILLATLEHWHRVFAGEAHFADPTYFYPERGALGFTDAYFLYGLAYAAGRGLGLDPFTSFMTVMVALAATGFFGFVRLLRRHFAVAAPWTAVGACLFAFANMNAVKLVQAQAYCAMLLPVLCDLALSAWSAGTWARRIGLAGGAGLLHALIFFTAYLTGWFFTAFLALIGLLHPLLFGPARTFALVREAVTTKRDVALAYAAGFLIGIAPFLAIYLPVLSSGRRREFAEVLANAPDARDILNVTTGNWLWGDILRGLDIAGRPNRPRWEVELGFTPITLAALLATILALAARSRRAVRHPENALSERDRWAFTFGAAVMLSWLVQLDYGEFRPWAAVFAAMPGAGAVRYTFRSQIVANLLAAVLVAYALASAAQARRAVVRRAIPVVAALLLIEQVNVDWPATISRRQKTEWLAAIPPPPTACRAFYLSPGAKPVDKPGYEHQADAMLFSQIRAIATVNGYSSWLPEGWMLEEPSAPDYPAAVRRWANANGLSAMCGLDPGAGRWTIGLPD